MSLSIKAVDRLFTRLLATYGSDFTARYKGIPEGDIKAVWAHELSWYENNMQALAWALENLPERAPNVIEFRNLARKAPAPEVPRLPEPIADKARVDAELAKLRPIIAQQPAFSHKEWAYRFINRAKAGDRVRDLYLKWAHEAVKA